MAVMPSRLDEFSRVTIEALALGTPVVVSDGVGACYLPQRDGSGAVFRSGDASSLTETILRVLGDPAFARVARERREAIGAEFSPSNLAARWVEMLRRCAGTGAASVP